MTDAYRPRGSALDLEIGLTAADVADVAPLTGTASVAPELFAHGIKRIVDYYVMGMHAAYGLSNFAAPTPFLLLLRRLTDELYSGMGSSPAHDHSAGNAQTQMIIRALYPESAETGHATSAPIGHAAAPVIVVGFPRSGTTWLQRMLQSHPLLAGPDGETCLFTSVRDVLANDALAAVAGHDAVVEAVRNFARGLCEHWQQNNAPDALRLVEKTPSNVDHLDTIVELFPDASIIGIYRDGRDVVHSLMQVQFGTDDPAVAAQAWASGVRKMLEFARKSDRIRVVRYEDMVAAPVDHARDLLDWLGLPAGDDVARTLEAQAATQVSQHRVRSTRVTPREQRAVYRYGGDLLADLGYTSAAEVKAMKRRPGYAVDLVRRRAARVLMRNR